MWMDVSMGATKHPRLRAPLRRAVLEAAAAQLFADRGYAGTRLDDIVAAANVTKPILYRHFASKKALYLELLARRRAQQLTAAWPVTTGRPGNPPISTLLERWFAQAREQPETWRLIFRDTTGDAEIRAVRQAAQDHGAMAGLALWSLDRPQVPPSLLASLIERTVLAVQRG